MACLSSQQKQCKLFNYILIYFKLKGNFYRVATTREFDEKEAIANFVNMEDTLWVDVALVKFVFDY